MRYEMDGESGFGDGGVQSAETVRTQRTMPLIKDVELLPVPEESPVSDHQADSASEL